MLDDIKWLIDWFMDKIWYMVGITFMSVGMGILIVVCLIWCPLILLILFINWWLPTSQD